MKIEEGKYYLSRDHEVYYIEEVIDNKGYSVKAVRLKFDSITLFTSSGKYLNEAPEEHPRDLVKEIPPEEYPEYFI